MLSAGVKLVVLSMNHRLSFSKRVIEETERKSYSGADITAKPLGLDYYKISPE